MRGRGEADDRRRILGFADARQRASGRTGAPRRADCNQLPRDCWVLHAACCRALAVWSLCALCSLWLVSAAAAAAAAEAEQPQRTQRAQSRAEQSREERGQRRCGSRTNGNCGPWRAARPAVTQAPRCLRHGQRPGSPGHTLQRRRQTSEGVFERMPLRSVQDLHASHRKLTCGPAGGLWSAIMPASVSINSQRAPAPRGPDRQAFGRRAISPMASMCRNLSAGSAARAKSASHCRIAAQRSSVMAPSQVVSLAQASKVRTLHRTTFMTRLASGVVMDRNGRGRTGCSRFVSGRRAWPPRARKRQPPGRRSRSLSAMRSATLASKPRAPGW